MLRQIQSLDESTKRTILIVSTIIIMAAVIYLWIGYFNGIVTAENPPAPIAGNTTQPDSGNAPDNSALGNIASAFANAFNGAVHWVGDALGNQGKYNIRPKY